MLAAKVIFIAIFDIERKSVVMGSTWQDTDSEDELPPGWEQKINPDGRIYFAE